MITAKMVQELREKTGAVNSTCCFPAPAVLRPEVGIRSLHDAFPESFFRPKRVCILLFFRLRLRYCVYTLRQNRRPLQRPFSPPLLSLARLQKTAPHISFPKTAHSIR